MRNGLNAWDTAAVKKLIERMLARWPNHKKNPAQLTEYKADIGALVERRGLDAIQKAVQEARLCKSFLPEPAELFELLPAVPDPAKPNLGPDPDCSACSGSGWKVIELPDPVHQGQTERRARRCPCKASVAPKAVPAPSPEQYKAILKEVLQGAKILDSAPAPDVTTITAKNAEVVVRAQEKLDTAKQMRWQRAEGETDKETRREATLQDSALRDMGIDLPMPPSADTDESPEVSVQ